MFVKTLLVAALPILAPAAASPLQKRDDIYVFTWGSANFGDYDTDYGFPAGACQAIATPSTGHVGSATVDSNASCNVYASSDCSGSVAGTFSAPGISDTGSLGDSFKSVKCSIPSTSTDTSTTAAAQASDSCSAA